MKIFQKIWKQYTYPLILLVIEAVLFVANYTPKTYLIGWDNVMPELNLKLNYLRALNAVWQDYRGLGTLDGMAHAANLFHVIYINILSFFLPQNLLRYSFVSLTHLVGGIAFYYLAVKLFKNKHGAFLGALFYLFNLGVIQMYFAPLEVFAMHFAALPLMGLAILNALKSKSKKSLLLLGAASLLTTPQAFVPTVFISYSLFAALLMVFSFKKELLKRITLICGILFITNAFWLLPFSYTALFKSQVVQNTRINEFSSEEIYYRNKAKGTISDVMTLKGFMIDTIEYDSFKKENFNFMQKWLDQTKTLPFKIISTIIAGLMILGSFLVVRFRLKSLYPFLATNIISFILLANNTPGLSVVNEGIRTVLPLFGEAFRFPFTKFITLFAFSYAMLFGLGVSFAIKFVLNGFSSIFKHVSLLKSNLKTLTFGLYLLFIAIISVSILWYAKPAFTGNFISPFLRLTVPNDYQKTMSYFNSQNPDGRILTFPLNSFWNWEYRNWGHRGSGFLWYGIPQPLLIRAFDPWSNYNEQLYNEFATSYANKDIASFDTLLKKYDISYILIDKTILNTISPKPVDYEEIGEFLNTSTVVQKDAIFGNELIYKSKNLPSKVSSLPLRTTINSYPSVTQQSEDSLELISGNYYESSKNPDVITLLSSLATLKLQKDNQFNWIYKNNVLAFNSKTVPINSKGKKIILPSLFEKEFLIPVSISTGENTVAITPIYPNVIVNGKNIKIPVNPIIIHTQNVTFPTKISFIDTNNTIEIGQNINSYLLNNFTNTIKISDGVNEEFMQIDTSSIDKTPLILDLPEKIKSFEVSVPTFDTELGKADYVKNKQYVITKASDQLKTNKPDTYSNSSVNAKGVNLSARDNTTSLDIYLDTLYHAASYAVIASIDHQKGLPVNFYVDNPKESKPVMETKMDNGQNIAILSGTDSYSKGYGFHFGVKSVGTEIAQSQINEVSIFPIPQKTIESIRIISPNSYVLYSKNPSKESLDYLKTGDFTYETTVKKDSLIVLSEAYDNGWKAYEVKNNEKLTSIFPFIFGKEIKSHVLVNNWANGWALNSQFSNLDSQLIIVYLPQYLEILGLALLGIPLLITIVSLYEKLILPQTNKLDSFFDRKTNMLREKIRNIIHSNS